MIITSTLLEPEYFIPSGGRLFFKFQFYKNVFIYGSDNNVAALWLLSNNDYENSLDLIRISLIYAAFSDTDRSQSFHID